MPRNGLVNGFYFDKEVFTDYMEEQSVLNNLLIDSGVLVEDATIADAVGSSSNVGTIPFFLPVDAEPDALNDDGKTDNVPTELQGSKQTFMAMARMKAWSQREFTRYLTGVNPLEHLANKLVVPYWKNQWEKVLYAELKAVMGVDGMESHVTDITTDGDTVTDANKIGLNTELELGQKALGDRRTSFQIFLCHSAVAKRLRELSLVENIAYFSDVLQTEITIDKYGDMILLETDTGTVDTSGTFPVYYSYMLGKGAFLTCPKTVYNPYDYDYDPEKYGGVSKIYTKQARVIHPNGFSFEVDNIVEESPTTAEIGNSANWELKFNHKLIPLALLKSNG